ncbi:metal-dependent hydrolase [Methanoculleus sp. MH98A]|uniref:metal-dependent hydrolase n=1 Tax=Methanoculleus sp. MH98A TaxID=1495314 RepID=UPI0012DF47EF|nr:metal-dependent hydrolase [Methanoculleus sp. MH98A]
MRGDQHVSLSLATAAFLIAPWATAIDAAAIAVLLSGVFIGSLAPDADAVDAAIFNGRIAGAKGKRGQVVNGFAWCSRSSATPSGISFTTRSPSSSC